LRKVVWRYPVEPLLGAVLGLLIGWGLFGLGIGALVGYFIRVTWKVMAPDSFEADMGFGAVSGSQETTEFPDSPGKRELEAYRILGVAPESSTEDIRKVYRTLAASFHPDSMTLLSESQRGEAEEAFVRIRSAWEQIAHSRGVRP